jgi:hypothetical protein
MRLTTPTMGLAIMDEKNLNEKVSPSGGQSYKTFYGRYFRIFVTS